jgi:hypothetical protein
LVSSELGRWEFLQQQALDCTPAGDPPAQQPGWKHFRVVEHEHIPGVQEVPELSKTGVLDLPRGTIDDQQPRIAARGRRVLRNQAIGELEIEFSDIHRC